MTDWIPRLESALGQSVDLRAERPVGGGDISAAVRLDTSQGVFFGKSHPGMDFRIEANSLQALRDSGTSLRIPPVVGHGPGWLLLEFVERGRPGPQYDEALGLGLAELHGSRADRYGFPFDTLCGATPQPNTPDSDWARFYGDRRIRYQAQRLRDAGKIDRRQLELFEGLAERLPELVGEPLPPSLIHGDLWSGNVFADGSGLPTLIDPAAYHAHPEAELGMMTLFGNFSKRVYDVLVANSDLASDWRARNEVYRLYHVMNHANLFGGGYVGSSVESARRCLSLA